MTTQELAKEIQKKTGMTYKDSYKLLLIVIDTIVEQVLKGQIVKLRNFVSLSADIAGARKYHNPVAQKTIEKPRRFVLKFTFSKVFKQKINDKKTYH